MNRKDICVLIPAFSEEKLIGRCIHSVLKAGVAPEDVYVIDDCSPDNTSRNARKFKGVNVHRNEKNLGKALGLRAALLRFDIIGRYRFAAVLDGDSYVGPDYIRLMLERIKSEPDAAIVCGGPESIRHNWITACRELEYLALRFVHRKGQSRLGVIHVASGCACVYRTETFRRFDWFGGTVADDIDTTVQVYRRGLGKIVFVPGAVVYTQDPSTIGEYYRQIKRWYSGFWQVMQRQRLPLGGQRIDLEYTMLAGEGLLFGLIVCLLPLWLCLSWKATLIAFGVDQAIAIGTAAVFAASGRRWDVLWYSPTFFLMRILNNVVFVGTFWQVVFGDGGPRKWYSVQRY